ncbi:MAG: hypothetical protein GDA51_01880 [Ekhidna sp.]|nr:hypothetical protein [Ekhidna sp.]MBC6425225.1 hypothetical protein [Ekhidna sp.]
MKRLIILFSIIFYSCSKQDVDAGLTAKEASLELRSTASEISADIIKMDESEGFNGMLDLIESYIFTSQEDEEGNVKLEVSEIFQDFVTGPFSEVSDDEIESFDDIKGRYVWNFETETFKKSASDFFIVEFPTEESSENNAEFRINELELEEFTSDEFKGEYGPKLIDAQLKVDDEEVISLDLKVEWSSDEFPDLVTIDMNMKPFSLTFGFDDRNAKSSSLLSTLKLNDKTIVEADGYVEFETERKEEANLVEGHIIYNNLKVEGKVLVNNDEEEDYDPNDFIDVEILINDKKAGDLVVIGDDDILYIEYPDGQTEEIEILFEEAIDEIEEFIDRIDEAAEALEES